MKRPVVYCVFAASLIFLSATAWSAPASGSGSERQGGEGGRAWSGDGGKSEEAGDRRLRIAARTRHGDRHGRPTAEVYRRQEDGAERRLGALEMRDGAGEAPVSSNGVYVVYVEDPVTGHIAKLDNDGKGFSPSGGDITLDLDRFEEEVRAIEVRDREEKEEKAKKPHGRATHSAGGLPPRPSPVAQGGTDDAKPRFTASGVVMPERSGGPAFAPLAPKPAAPGTGAQGETRDNGEGVDEILVRYSNVAGLSEKYTFVAEVSGEARSKLAPIGVYRLKLTGNMDSEAVVRAYAADPRIKYVEPNLTMTIPQPVTPDTRRSPE